MTFIVNNILWHLEYVDKADGVLIRSDGVYTFGVTDRNSHTIYISNAIYGGLLDKVICHELVHCFMFSYGIEMSIEQEEFMADFIATYGFEIIALTNELRTSVLAKYRQN